MNERRIHEGVVSSPAREYTHRYPDFVADFPVRLGSHARRPEARGLDGQIRPVQCRSVDEVVEAVAWS